MQEHQVNVTFKKLDAEIDAEIKALNQQGAQLFTEGKYDEARLLIAKVEKINTIREKIKLISQDWEELKIPSFSIQPSTKEPTRHRPTKRLKQGFRTKEEDFKIPLLQTLVQMGGRGVVADVLDTMEALVKPMLTEHDLIKLNSTDELRWRNTVKWARADMVKEGLLKSDSPYSVWEISDSGRQWLKETNPKHQENKEYELNNQDSRSLTRHTPKTNATGLQQIIEVCHEMFKGKNYNEAAEYVANVWGLKSIHTVYDACTRRLGLSTQEFKLLVKDRNKLVQFLVIKFPKDERCIIENLSLKNQLGGIL